ncbi:MAG: aminotransferase class I/II-fold pyridoxal phosphate-dependent enzyme, partial [Burkholderiales bacterium]
ARAGPGDVVLLHGCCHNPTGAELQPEHWDAIADLAIARGFLPFVDFAYQGFGDGLEEDALGVRRLAARVPQMVVAASCSKNFGLYRDRVGCAFVLGASPERADVMLGQLLGVARANYSSPPAHGAAIVGTILDDAIRRAEWRAELDDMRAHMQGLRAMLAASLRSRSNGERFDFLARHRGMFSLIGASPEQVERLRDEHAVHMVGSGRINIAGLPDAEVDRFAEALIAVLGR